MKARPFKGVKIGRALTIALLLALTAGNAAAQSPTELPAKDLSTIDLSKSEGAKYFLLVGHLVCPLPLVECKFRPS